MDDIKKKLQNEKEEEEKDDLDLNNSDTERRNSKSEDDESIKESKKFDLTRKVKKNTKKNVSKIQKQKKV